MCNTFIIFFLFSLQHIKNEYLPYNRQSFTIQMKPMSHQQRCYVQKHHCFLLRNYEKVKKAKDQARLTAEKEAELERSASKQGNCVICTVIMGR